MTPVFAARRRAEEFAALVERPSAGGLDDARFGDLLELVGTLREAPAAEARPAFVAALRERLMLAADAVLVPSQVASQVASETARLTLPPRRSTRDRRIAAAVGGLALVGATTSMAMAAQGALPGDVLYPIKRAIENAQTGVTVDEGDKGESLLANASGRLDEVSALSRSGDLDSLAIADTLDAFTEQATAASDLLFSDFAQTGQESSIADLRDFTATSLDQLTALEPLVPAEARDELMHAAHVLFGINAAAEQACPGCGGARITQIPSVFVPVSSGVLAGEAGPAVSQGPARPSGGPKSQAPDPDVPPVDGGSLPPGSVLNPNPAQEGGGSTAPSAQGGGEDDPIGALTEGLTNGGGSQPTSSPSGPDLGGLGGLLGHVDDVTDPLAP